MIMQDDIGKVKGKIKKLFALSKSPNANEAAAALEMAQKLMAEHGVRLNNAGVFETAEHEIKGNGGAKPPRYEVYLMSRIAKAFGCRNAYGLIMSAATDNRGFHGFNYGYSFVGLEHRVETASFIAEVLLRKLKKARAEYAKKLNRVRLRGNKIKRADDFCLGWAVTAASKLREFTNTPDEQAAVDGCVESLDWNQSLKTMNRGKVKGPGIKDFSGGLVAAAGVQIQHGMEGRENGARLLGA
jgi:hypothetical protein